ncbi:NAD(P)/FAD-dependent oxidoreductase [Vreelandella venusta]|uniref:FAD-dependent oxidoreductase n=1 Tax=Vreelandella venusta TaxID=44935 RepID=A0AAP9ZMA2_9GAMM|nr:FAD-dependent oxidoreductase [Halomonas venusta]QRL03537.1 FAD-dependent oxidoreductase [Halomonas venusta]
MLEPLPESLPLSGAHSVAVIGAGLSGLACGQQLANQGVKVALFDKARGPGGRMSSKRRPSATLDLGAQAFTVRDPRFANKVAEWQAAGCVARWPTSCYQASASGWQTHSDAQLRYTGTPRMSALTRHLADTLNALPNAFITFQTHIATLDKTAAGWQLHDTRGSSHGPFDMVVISAPPPQAKALLAAWEPTLAAACEAKSQRGCWAGWVIFEKPLPPMAKVDAAWHTVHTQHPALRLASRNHTKPGREHQPESISLLAQLDWSDAHIESDSDSVAQQLLAAFVSLLPDDTELPNVLDLGAHRWRYAQPAQAGHQAYLYSTSGLALCGDSFKGSRVEDAWLSGDELGKALLGRSV